MGFGINNPVPRSLGSESRKAAKILTSFVKPNQIISYDEVIPPHILQQAKGLCIITVIRAGFLFSGRAGSGVIVARLPDGTWSPPSAVMTAGAGAGGMIGADLTDFIFVLNSREAVNTFASAGTLQLGGNVSLAAGPLGRAGEAAGAAGTSGVATVFSYAKTKGLYAGISLEGSVLVERKDANQKFYGRPVPAKAILSGRIPAPRAVEPLFRVLDTRAFRSDIGVDEMDDEFYNDLPDEDYYDDLSTINSGRTGRGGAAYGSSRKSGRYADEDDAYDDYDDGYDSSSRNWRGGGSAAPVRRAPSSARSPGRSGRSGRYADDYEYDADSYDDDGYDSRRRSGAPSGSRSSRRYADDYDDEYRPRRRRDSYEDDDDYYAPRSRSGTASAAAAAPVAPPPKPKPKTAGGMQGIALYSFGGEESGDLAFKKGDVITITAKSDSTDDWWTGELNGRTGIFPANYIELV